MEAQSFAPLTLLAANPPQYPENPSETIREPLVLYISRVPGTRDVILSPSKPQLKNVTTGDVASALYYVHFELPMLDKLISRPLANEAQGRSGEGGSVVRTIARKPVPGSISSPRPSISIQRDQLQQPQMTYGNPTLRSQSDPDVLFNSQDANYTPHLRPRRFEDSGLGLSDSSSELNARGGSQQLPVSASRRKPIGPRQPSDLSQRRSDVGETERSRDQTRDQTAAMGHTRQSRSLSPMKDGEYSTPAFTLNLIRRNPGTGDQWNVGKISSCEVKAMAGETGLSTTYVAASSERQRPPQLPHPPIDICIESAGYAKFRERPSTTTAPRRSMDADRPPRADGMFFRQVSMSYSPSFGSTILSKLHQIEQAARKKAHNRSESEASANSLSSGDNMSRSPASPRPDKMKPRGYTFTSPWGGRCEFRTGASGRSLQCCHFLHEGEVGAYNPLVPGASASRSTSAAVSELRFDLPGSELFPSGEAPKGDDRRLGHFSKLAGSAMERLEDKDEDDVISPFDINMGGERAGGGKGGKRAKLGKLIIYHDGLKMLDLLVAANMGVWWGIWEKSF